MTQGDSAYQLRVLQEALQLAEQAGREKDAVRREMLIGECMAALAYRAASKGSLPKNSRLRRSSTGPM